MTKEEIIKTLKRKKANALKDMETWNNKPSHNIQDKITRESWSTWYHGQVQAYEDAISIVGMLGNSHNRYSKND